MAFIPVDDGGTVVLHGTGPSGVVYENVLGIQLSGALDQAATDSISDLIATAFDGNISDYLSDTVSYNGITVTDLRTETGPQFDSDEGWPLVGASSGHALPLQTCALITWGTGLRGRSYRGRTYIGGYSETYSNGAHMESAAHTGLADFADGILATNLFGVISRFSGFTEPGHVPVKRDPAIITPFESRIAHDLWATQRRRAPR